MRALVYYGNKDVRLENDWRDPELLNDEDAIIKVNFTSICATDIEEWQFGPNYIQPEDTPVVHGHEITGEVIEVGKNSSSIKIGDKVAVNNVIHCNNCFWCLKGQGGACVSMKVAGFHEDGGLSEFMRWPSDHLIRVSDSIPDEHGALIEPTSVACHVIRKSGVRPGDNVAVVGCGTVGLLTIQVLKAAGANVSAVDIRPESLQLAKDFGADYVFNSADEDIIENMMEASEGIGHDIVFETAGSAEAPKISIDYTRRGGKTILVGIYSAQPKMDFNQIVFFEREVIGSVGSAPGDMEAGVQLLNQGKINPAPLISKVISLDNVIEEGYQKMANDPKGIFRILVKP